MAENAWFYDIFMPSWRNGLILSFSLFFKDIDHEIRCLRKWFKLMESSLEPLNFRAKYTKTEIEKKGLELKVGVVNVY